MINIIIIVALALIFGLSIYTIIRQKKKGVKCIGCPGSPRDGESGCTSSCNCNTEK
ncbi:MAG: FeoB-associated Cys-rich membrane protein [Treponema sp.]|nr:MAG: FeoB-associated Cys-rich membrane protein [Treponema sp.]